MPSGYHCGSCRWLPTGPTAKGAVCERTRRYRGTGAEACEQFEPLPFTACAERWGRERTEARQLALFAPTVPEVSEEPRDLGDLIFATRPDDRRTRYGRQ